MYRSECRSSKSSSFHQELPRTLLFHGLWNCRGDISKFIKRETWDAREGGEEENLNSVRRGWEGMEIYDPFFIWRGRSNCTAVHVRCSSSRIEMIKYEMMLRLGADPCTRYRMRPLSSFLGGCTLYFVILQKHVTHIFQQPPPH